MAREVRANPGDLQLAREYRASLGRLVASDPAQGYALLDELQGVWTTPESLAHTVGLSKDLALLSALRVGSPVLAPRAPLRWEPLWEARGSLLWLSAGLVLLETSDHSLEAHCPASGGLLWSMPSILPTYGELGEDQRVVAHSWATAPWGAVEVYTRYDAPLEYRRVGRYHPELGRVTKRELVDRGPATVEASFQLAAPSDGTWSREAPPERLVERLAHAELHLEDWSDELVRLSLDQRSRTFALLQDFPEAWAVFEVGGGGTLPFSVAPAVWSPEGHPFQENQPSEEGPRWELVADGGVLSLSEELAGGAMRAPLDGRTLVAGTPRNPNEAGLVVADGRGFLQLGGEALHVFGEGP